VAVDRTRSVAAGGGLTTCKDCLGSGAVDCKVCGGKGEVPCPKCGAGAAPAAGPAAPIGAAATEAINKVIALANYLRAGGVDFWSPEALKSSPRLIPTP
jgi:hypothetical protein